MLLAAGALAGCHRGAGQLVAAWVIEPALLASGTAATVRVTLRGAGQQPVVGAHLQLEAHMSHPGMAPVVTPVTERSAGVYEGGIRFTMAGDWVLVLTGTLRDGTRVMETHEIAGVRPAG